MTDWRRWSGSWLAIGAAFVATAAVAQVLFRPLRAEAVGYDITASVVHFERLVAGRHLESFVTATPKPLMTVIDGALMALVDDWRVVAGATIVAFAAAVAAATALATRSAGIQAGLLAGFFVLSSARLLDDVAIAYAVSWAALLCLLAGLAVTGPRPRPALAGLALGAATLARLEVVAIVATALVVLLVGSVASRLRGTARPQRSWWWLLIALAAFPIMAIHDWLLTGDPLFWMTVSQAFSRALPDSVLSPIGVVGLIAGALWAEWPLVLLGVAGAASLWRSRQWAVLVGLAGSTLGVAAFLVAVAVRGTYVSYRYVTLIDLGVRFVAGIGLAVCVAFVGNHLATRRRSAAPWLPVVAAFAASAVLAVVATWRPGFIDPAVRRTVSTTQRESAHAEAALPVLRCAIGSLPGGVPMPPPDTTLATTTPGGTVLLVPGLLEPRLAHDLGIPLGAIDGLAADELRPTSLLPRGLIALHDRLSDRPTEAFRVLEVDRPTAFGDATLTPLVSDPRLGVWIVWIGRPDGPAAPTRCARATLR